MEPSRPEGSSLAPTTPTSPAVARADLRARRWHLVRDLAVFQLKLFIDGLKDLVLAPIAVVVVLIGLLTKQDDPGRTFYSILRLGHGFDRWLNLFGTPEQRALVPWISDFLQKSLTGFPEHGPGWFADRIA